MADKIARFKLQDLKRTHKKLKHLLELIEDGSVDMALNELAPAFQPFVATAAQAAARGVVVAVDTLLDILANHTQLAEIRMLRDDVVDI